MLQILKAHKMKQKMIIKERKAQKLKILLKRKKIRRKNKNLQILKLNKKLKHKKQLTNQMRKTKKLNPIMMRFYKKLKRVKITYKIKK